jgi:regulator of protease activity HflC (stomatin/prohibitin superfamily)
MTATIILVLVCLVLITRSINVFREYERGVLFRLGRFVGVRGPGFVAIIPFIDRIAKVGLRTVTHDVPPQDVITKDNISVKVNAVVYYRVFDAEKAVIEVEDYGYATSQLAQTTLRSVIGAAELDELLSHREKINQELQSILDRATDVWGIKVSAVEVKHVDLPEAMQRAIARQAEAERERRSKIIHAEGELQASQTLQTAAKVLAAEPTSIQLRYLQTLSEIATEKNSTIIFPIPIDIIDYFLNGRKKSA